MTSLENNGNYFFVSIILANFQLELLLKIYVVKSMSNARMESTADILPISALYELFDSTIIWKHLN